MPKRPNLNTRDNIIITDIRVIVNNKVGVNVLHKAQSNVYLHARNDVIDSVWSNLRVKVFENVPSNVGDNVRDFSCKEL